MTDKLPPQNIEAEEAILEGILLEPLAIGRVASTLTPDAFYVPAQYCSVSVENVTVREK